MIFHKNLKVLLSLKISEKDLDMMFNNVQNGKKGFLDYKNVILKSVKMSVFAKGLTMIFHKNLKVILSP